MPVHQITVVPARENGQSAQDGKDQGSEGKPPARSGSRSSTVSKAGNLAVAAGPTGGASKTSITPSSQDICSMTVPGATLAPPPPKKQVKRRRRHRKRSGYGPLDCTGAKERDPERRPPDRPSRLLCLDSTSEDERPAAARSWSREKSRRARRRQRGRTPDDVTEVMELQSLGSDEAKGGAPPSPPEAAKTPDESQTSSPGADKAPASSPSSEETLTTSYRETGAGPEDTAETQKGRGVNGAPPLALLSDDSETEVCRICHCEGDEESPLITPCHCTGSLSFVHHACLYQWIKSSDTRCCELCSFRFVMETTLKPLCQWEELHMTKSERRKIYCSVLFHLVAIVCMLCSVSILVKRTVEELKLGKNGILEWPFWTKLIVVSVGFFGGLVFMYVQCKIYLQLWRRLVAFNRIITVQNCPDKNPLAEGKRRNEPPADNPV
ncbi:uncharacterized protein marchf1 isoform X4 [Stigmatopora nigra]